MSAALGGVSVELMDYNEVCYHDHSMSRAGGVDNASRNREETSRGSEDNFPLLLWPDRDVGSSCPA